jgi:hypothetical protein
MSDRLSAWLFDCAQRVGQATAHFGGHSRPSTRTISRVRECIHRPPTRRTHPYLFIGAFPCTMGRPRSERFTIFDGAALTDSEPDAPTAAGSDGVVALTRSE